MGTNNQAKKRPFWFSVPVLYAVMITLGILSGLSDIEPLKATGLFVADVFIRIFKCISLPIIALSIIVTLAHYRSEGIMKRVWRRTMCYTLGTTLIAASISCLLYLLIHPSLVTAPSDIPHDLPTAGLSYLSHVSHLIPENIFAPFLENQVLSVLFLSIVVGVAIRSIPNDDARATITHFFSGAHGMMMVITRWVILIIPIGLYGFITSTVIQMRSGSDLKGIGEYLLIVVLANVIQGFIVLPMWLRFKGIKPFLTMRRMMPALSLAFFTKSSVGALPVTMDTMEQKLGVRPELSRFVLPLCTSINMNGCAAFIFATVVYLMQNHGITLSLPAMGLWIVVATVAAIGNAGIPMGCFFLSASLLASMNVPITLMGIILPFYSLIDMLETALNVWSDSCVTKVVDEHVVDAAEVEPSRV
ncbi:MAG: dicarboxylate/amino acid:cation symporter [Legionellaceae bacterium]|nr:dicarboxylate/amino acid:cation symporter [Legionellaceae bacterium]